MGVELTARKLISSDIRERSMPWADDSLRYLLMPFYESHTFQDLLHYAEYKAPKTEVAFLTGSMATRLVHTELTKNWVERNSSEWLLKQTGNVNVSNQSFPELDIWATTGLVNYLVEKSRSNFYKQRSRTVTGLTLTNFIEKNLGGNIKLQVHTIPDSILTPMQLCMWLAPTILHMVGISVVGSHFILEDPKCALITEYDRQRPPIQLISEKNPFRRNIGRIISGLMIYALTTPLNDKFDLDYDSIERYINDNLSKLSEIEIAVLLEKFDEWGSKMQIGATQENFNRSTKQLERIGLMSFILARTKFNLR